MKTKLLILMMAVALFTNVRAQETWFNIDFSSSEWLTAFNDATGTDPTGLGNNSFINVLPADGNPGTSVTVNEEVFLFDGNFFRDGTSDVYCFRLRNTGTFGLIQLPEVPNAGKVTLNVTNGNGTTASNVTINVKKVSDESITPVVLEMPGGTTKQDLVFNINIDEPVILSIVGGSTFCKVYSIVVEKYSDVVNPVGPFVEVKSDEADVICWKIAPERDEDIAYFGIYKGGYPDGELVGTVDHTQGQGIDEPYCYDLKANELRAATVETESYQIAAFDGEDQLLGVSSMVDVEVGTTIDGIATPSLDQEPVKTQYFTIDGRETTAPVPGLYIVKKTFNDNSVKTEKLFVK